MQVDRFTKKSVEAINDLQKIAMDFGNQEIEQEHLLYALLHQDGSLIAQLLDKMGVDRGAFQNSLKHALDKKVKSQGGQQYVGQYLNHTLNYAEDEAKRMGDEYVSVEHLFLAMLRNPSPSLSSLLQQFGITVDAFLSVLKDVRGNQTVTTDSPEETYDSLKKYGTDLVQRAREQKLDPIIGRDDEIRNVILLKTQSEKAILNARRAWCYLVLVLISFLCLFFFYVLVINSTRTHFEIQKGFSLVPGKSIVTNLRNVLTDANIPRDERYPQQPAGVRLLGSAQRLLLGTDGLRHLRL